MRRMLTDPMPVSGSSPVRGAAVKPSEQQQKAGTALQLQLFQPPCETSLNAGVAFPLTCC